MTTIYTGASNQVPTRHAGGREGMQGEDSGKGGGRFEDAFEGIAASGANASAPNRNGGEDGRLPVDQHFFSADGQETEIGAEARASASGRSDEAKAQPYRPLAFERQADHGTKPGPDANRGSRLELSAKAASKSPGGRDDGELAGDARDGDPTVPTSDYDGLLSLLAANEAAKPDQIDAATAASVPVATAPSGRPGRAREAGPGDASGRGDRLAASSDTAEHAAMDEALEGSGADRIFRLARSDGRAKPIDMAISANGESATPKEPAGTAARIEAVTVLDSRRYLGLAQTGNSIAVTAAIAQDPSWAAALTEAADRSPDTTGKVVNTLKIQLHPIDLGTVTATLRLQGEALVVDLKVETGKAYRNLSDEQDAIVKALRGHGFSIDQVSVQLTSASDRSGGAGQGDAQAQFSGQQQAREGSGRPNGGEPRYSGNAASNEGMAHDNGQAGSLDGSGQRRGTGGVYL